MKLTSIPTLLQQEYGGKINQMHRSTGFSELTITKYKDDVECRRHIIVNGQLMVAHKNSKPIE